MHIYTDALVSTKKVVPAPASHYSSSGALIADSDPDPLGGGLGVGSVQGGVADVTAAEGPSVSFADIITANDHGRVVGLGQDAEGYA